MLVFVIPLKSPEVSKSWEQVSKLFERCVKSICHQTSPNFRVVVVCNEKPTIEFSHPHITYLKVNFSSFTEKEKLNNQRTDKGRKILNGLVYANQFKPSHTMAVDADDCVSKNLAEFVSQNPDANGWFVNRGYKYQDGSDYIYIKYRDFYKMCGSCNIIRYDLNEIPEQPEYNRGYGYYKYYIDHAKPREHLAKKGKKIAPLPFAGAVYVVDHGQHQYYHPSRLSFSLINRRRLSPPICEEFGLYKIS
ncbi:MAG: glycosyltransferase family 2 protein [Coleofasciculus sp. S288]|nr:glycosyltransferase family 2 protein [Coleofasciculus sp. S288]